MERNSPPLPRPRTIAATPTGSGARRACARHAPTVSSEPHSDPFAAPFARSFALRSTVIMNPFVPLNSNAFAPSL